jgi:hypothetical protein
MDKCIICQVSTPELLIKMRNVRSRRLNLEETAISSTCVRLIARPVVQHTCIITPKIINIRNRMYYSKKRTRRTQVDEIAVSSRLSRRALIINQTHHRFLCWTNKPMTRLQTLHCAYSEENRLSMRLFLLTFLILISNSGVKTWHIIHLSHSISFLLFLELEGQSLS